MVPSASTSAKSPGHRVADAVDGAEGGRRLGLVLVVAERDPTAQGQHPAPTGTGHDVLAVGVEHPDLGTEGESGRLGRAGCPMRPRSPCRWPPTTRRRRSAASRVVARRPCLVSSLHITPDEMMPTRLVRSQRPGWASRVARMGLAKASPDDDQAVDLLPFHGVEQLDRVELAGGEGDHPAPLAQALEGGEPTGAVHERAGRQAGSMPRSAPLAARRRTSSSPPSSG